MTDQDLFFTQTIVGMPTTVTMGRPLTKKDLRIQTNPHAHEAARGAPGGGVVLMWKDWAVIDGAGKGRPRRLPGRIRRWLERYALVLAVLALALLLTQVVVYAALFATSSTPMVGGLWSGQ